MTRKKSRSGSAGKGIAVGIVAAIVVILTLFILQSLGYQYAFAVTRDEVDNLESKINEIEDKIESLDIDIDNQKQVINDKDKVIRDSREELRKVKAEANGSWEKIKQVNEYEVKYSDAQKEYQEARTELLRLLSEKSDNIKSLKELNKQLINDRDTLKKQSKADLSNLVKKIGIINSNSINVMHQNNVTNPYLTYKQMITLDSSDTSKSGKFTTDDNGFFHRGSPQVENDCRVYDTDTELRIFVDPSAYCQSRIKIIELRPHFDNYFDKADMAQKQEFELIEVMVNSTFGNVTQTKAIQVLNQTQEYARVIYHDRYVDKSCSHAVINADKALILLPDTIHFMRNNCDDGFTAYITKEIIPINATFIDITQSQKYKDDKRLEFIKTFCIFKYKACEN
jgi:hypothetical protein